MPLGKAMTWFRALLVLALATSGCSHRFYRGHLRFLGAERPPPPASETLRVEVSAPGASPEVAGVAGRLSAAIVASLAAQRRYAEVIDGNAAGKQGALRLVGKITTARPTEWASRALGAMRHGALLDTELSLVRVADGKVLARGIVETPPARDRCWKSPGGHDVCYGRWDMDEAIAVTAKYAVRFTSGLEGWAP
jgi:hypothetical protein